MKTKWRKRYEELALQKRLDERELAGQVLTLVLERYPFLVDSFMDHGVKSSDIRSMLLERI